MEARLLRRPLADLLSTKAQCLFPFNAATKRHESSYRRSKKRLNIGPDSTFVFNKSSPQQDHIIFNPPSAAPSVLHTPVKFLPKEDKRRPLFEATAARLISPRAPGTPRLPPIVPRFKPVGLRHHLTEKDIQEIQKLRAQDPVEWNVRKLAKKFDCSSIFISIVSRAPAEKVKKDKEMLEARIARWGPKRTKAREDKLRRFQLALRDE